MPAVSVEVDHEILAMLGKLPEAMRAAEKEAQRLERQLAQAAKRGQNLDPNVMSRQATARAAAESYREAYQREREIKEIAQEEAKKILAAGGSAEDAGVPMSSGAKKTTARQPLSMAAWQQLRAAGVGGRRPVDGDIDLFGKMRWALNTHNPHGSIRGMLTNPNLNSMTGLMSRFGVGGAAAGAGAAAILGMYKLAQIAADDKNEAVQIQNKSAGEAMTLARSFRFSPAAEQTEFLTSLAKAGLQARVLANERLMSGRNPLTMLSPQEATRQMADAYGRKVAEFLSDVGKRNTEGFRDLIRDPGAFLNDPAVQHKFSYTQMGPWGWIKHKLGYMTGASQQEELQASMKRGEQIMSEQQRRRATMTKEFYDQNPNATVSRIDMENNVHAVRQWQMERFTDWNSY